jgi:ubiquinone/menaquinone biosynthesis C-methylase UbiE
MTVAQSAHELTLGQLIAETGDPALSMASGGRATITDALALMQLRPGGRYCEIGCAAGEMTNRVADLRRDLNVIGVDQQAVSVEAARQLAAAWGLVNVTYLQGDARRLPLPARGFDGVFSGNVPSFLPGEEDRAAVIRECARVVAEWGVVVAVPVYYVTPPPADLLEQVERVLGAPVGQCDADYWPDLYEEVGLFPVHREQRGFRTHADVDLKNYVGRVMASRHNQRHEPDYLRELGVALLERHRLFEANNRHAAYEILVLRPNDRHVLYDDPLTGA